MWTTAQSPRSLHDIPFPAAAWLTMPQPCSLFLSPAPLPVPESPGWAHTNLSQAQPFGDALRSRAATSIPNPADEEELDRRVVPRVTATGEDAQAGSWRALWSQKAEREDASPIPRVAQPSREQRAWPGPRNTFTMAKSPLLSLMGPWDPGRRAGHKGRRAQGMH